MIWLFVKPARSMKKYLILGFKTAKSLLWHIAGAGETRADLSREVLVSWLIDDHVHCFEEMTLYYDYPDEIGVKQGVTTVIDAGTTGAENIHRLWFSQRSQNQCLCFSQHFKWGIVEQDELADLSKSKNWSKKHCRSFLTLSSDQSPNEQNGDRRKWHHAVEISENDQAENQPLPLMVHIGSQHHRI